MRLTTILGLTILLLTIWLDSAGATVLTFDVPVGWGDVPDGYGNRVDGESLDFEYPIGNGFTPNIAVNYLTREPGEPNSSIVSDHVDVWTSSGYGDLSFVAIPTSSRNAMGEITFAPDDGFQVQLSSFDVAAFGTFTDQPLRIVDRNDVILWDAGPLDISRDDGRFQFQPNIVSDHAIRLQWGDNWDVGVSNISFGQLSRPFCDLNIDDKCDSHDVDVILSALGSTDPKYNFHEPNPEIDLFDVEAFLTQVGNEELGFPIRMGDTNLDGNVDSVDLNNLGLFWRQEVGQVHWSRGDFNGDGFVDSADLNRLARNWRYPDAPLASVPEPRSFAWAYVLFAMLLRHRTGHQKP